MECGAEDRKPIHNCDEMSIVPQEFVDLPVRPCERTEVTVYLSY